jgi:hypothetical protein
MTKEVKLNQEEKSDVVANTTPQDVEELKEQLSQEEVNVKNSKELRNQLKKISHNDLLGFIVLFNDNEAKRVGVISSIDQGVTQFVALAHSGHVDQYDQIINQVITTRTIERMRGVQTPPPGMITKQPMTPDEAVRVVEEGAKGQDTEEASSTPDGE